MDDFNVNLEILAFAAGMNTATMKFFVILKPILAAVVAGQPLTVGQALVMVRFCDHIIAQATHARGVLERYGCAVAGVASDRVM